MPLDLSAPPVAGIALRTVEARDDAFLRALYYGVREAELAATPWDEPTKRAFANSQFDLQDRWYRSQYEGVKLLVIEHLGEPIGRLYLHEFPSELRLMEITLLPARRNAGLGTALIEWLKGLAAGEGRAVTLYVEGFNPARALYARLGFTEETTEGIYIRCRWTPGEARSG
jgi:GNAT superfamily N-acetyltransferase